MEMGSVVTRSKLMDVRDAPVCLLGGGRRRSRQIERSQPSGQFWCQEEAAECAAAR